VPSVDLDRDTRERRDTIEDEQGVALGRADAVDVVAHARGRLGVDDGDDLGRRMRFDDRFGIERLAPRRLDSHYVGAIARRDIAHALTEHAVDAHHHNIAGFDNVHERGFHAR